MDNELNCQRLAYDDGPCDWFPFASSLLLAFGRIAIGLNEFISIQGLLVVTLLRALR